jgi:malate dehydrogenase
VIGHSEWLHGDFIARCSSAALRSSRPAAPPPLPAPPTRSCDTVRSVVNPTPAGDWTSVCVCSDGSYGLEKGIICSFPIRSDGKKLEVVQGLPLNDFAKQKIAATVNELKEEREMVKELIPA